MFRNICKHSWYFFIVCDAIPVKYVFGVFVVWVFFRCHLPMLYIGLEYGLTNNSKLAERFFSQALSIAPEDPFVMHEVGVVAFQNGE